MYKLLALALTSLALITGIWWNGYAAGVHKWKPIAQSYKHASRLWEGRAHAWKASFDLCEDRRDTERDRAADALDAEKSSCGGKITRQKESDRRFRLSLEKPIKLDGQGCFARDQITLAKDAGWRP